MKHTYLLLLLLLTVSVGRSFSYGHGVKGSINKSYSSSSASASSSAFSSSYSSGLADSDGSNNALKASSGAFSSAFAGSGTDGASAKVGSGAFAGAGSGALSGSGSFSGTGLNSQSGSYAGSGSVSGSGASQGLGHYSGESNKAYGGETGPGHIPVVAVGSGAISGSGSYISGSGPHNTGPGHIPVVAGGSGTTSGSGSYISGQGPHNLGPVLVPATGSSHTASANDKLNPQISETPCGGNAGCSISGSQRYSGSGIIVGIGAPGQDSDKILPTNGANSYAGASGNNIRVNDFQIPEEYSPKTQFPDTPKHQFPGPQGSIYDSKPVPQGGGVQKIPDIQKIPEQHTYIQSGSIENSYANSNAGSFKPGSCKSCKGPFPGPKGNINDYKPAPQGGPPAWIPEQQTQPPLVRPPIDISKFPGSPGSIYDSKPVNPGGGKIPVGIIPVVIGGPQYNQRPQNQPSYNQGPHNQPAFNQGPHNQPTNQGPYNQHTYNQGPQNQPTYNQEAPQPKPGAIAVSVIGKLPGPTGNIHNSVEVGKPVIQQVPVSIVPGTYDFPGQPGNNNNNKPVSGHGCINGQCLNQPDFRPEPNNKPGYPDCTHGECDEFGGRLGCHGDDCFGPGKKPSYGHSGSDDKTQSNSNAQHQNGNINYNFNQPTPGNYKPDCSRGQCNINGAYYPEKSLPGAPGKTCSGFECLDHAGPQVNVPVVVVPEPVKPEKVDHKISPEHPKLDFDIDLRQKPDNYYNPIHKEPSDNSKHTSSNSNANAHSPNNQEKINVQIDQQPDHIPNDIPVEADYPSTQHHPKESSTSNPNLHEEKPGESRDFLLPGNKPYHRHHVKPHRPSHEKDHPRPTQDDRPKKSHDDQPNLNHENHPEGSHPQPLPGSTYYKCTGESCELPKPGGSHPEEPGKTYYSCSGSSCPLPHVAPNQPEPSTPGCHGNQCGAGGKDRLFPSPFVPPTSNNGPSVSPVVLPVLIGVPPQGNQELPRPGNQDSTFGGKYSGSESVANAGANSFKETGDDNLPGTGHLPLDHSLNNPYNKNNGCSSGTCQLLPGLNSQGFVSGNVVVQKADGQQVPVIDVHIPNNQAGHGQPCSGSKCSLPNQPGYGGQYIGGNAGSYSGYSGVQPCTKGNCRTSSQPGNGGAYSGGISGGISGSKSENSDRPCGNGNCGHGINAVQFGGHSGAQSGSFSGASNFGGVKGGAHIPINGGSYSGSGAFSGSNAGSFSSANSGNGQDANFKALKDILSESLKYSGLQGEVPGAFGAGSFAHSGASSHGSSSAYSGAFSSAGSY